MDVIPTNYIISPLHLGNYFRTDTLGIGKGTALCIDTNCKALGICHSCFPTRGIEMFALLFVCAKTAWMTAGRHRRILFWYVKHRAVFFDTYYVAFTCYSFITLLKIFKSGSREFWTLFACKLVVFLSQSSVIQEYALFPSTMVRGSDW